MPMILSQLIIYLVNDYFNFKVYYIPYTHIIFDDRHYFVNEESFELAYLKKKSVLIKGREQNNPQSKVHKGIYFRHR